MDTQQVLDLIAELPAREIRPLWDAGEPVSGDALRPGLWLGRNGGMARPFKWLARTVVKRDYFAKLVLDGFGINVRVRQDGSHGLLASTEIEGGVKVDLPFALAPGGFEFGFHVAGFEPGTLLQFRDVMRRLDVRSITSLVEAEALARVGASCGEGGEGSLIVGYMAPFGVDALKGAPFCMAWRRESTAGELGSARAWLSRRRLIDSSVLPGRQGRSS